MALDVRLCREEDEDWGFELFGGADEEMPLTIEKIQPDSPAKRAGLLNGDTILTINGQEAIDWSLETACRKVAACGDNLIVGVMRGLYDPVLDDQEPIYDYGPEDLDQQLEPTEVSFKIQQFVEPSDLGSSLLDYGISPTPGTNITESRSLTASPFLTPTKPYRPFSTEPVLEVPPLEDPIILNPNYRDQFGKSPVDTDPDYLLNAHYNNDLDRIQGRFKLPISEQYDPDGTRFVQNVEVVDKLLKYEKHVKSLSKDLKVTDITKETKPCDAVSKDVKENLATEEENFKITKKDVRISEEILSTDIQITEKKEMLKEELEEQAIKEELQYIEKMRQEIDLNKIEETALSIVDDSIERAVSVAEEIQKEIEVEFSSEQISEKVCESEKNDQSKIIKSEKIEKSSEITDATESFEVEKQATKITRKSISEDVESKVEKRDTKEERIESLDETSQRTARKDFKEVREETSERIVNEDSKIAAERKSLITENREEVIGEPMRKESFTYETQEKKGEFTKVTKTFATGAPSAKNEAQQRAYTIGLQTIPNIRGVVHSSYHYDLLLRTFFLHLTDVMVALSRFVLTQPIFNELASHVTDSHKHETEKAATEIRRCSQSAFETAKRVEKQKGEEVKTKIVEAKHERKEITKPVLAEVKQEIKGQKVEKDMKVESVQEKKIEKKDTVMAVEAKQEQIIEQASETKVLEVIEKKPLTGAQMAQRSEKKLSHELTQKMDAVISEFQSVAVEEDVKKEMLQRNRRSRSRSQIEEEVMKEGDPLEWLEKVDSRRTSQERTEISKSDLLKKEISSSETMEKINKVEGKVETRHKKPKTPKQVYIAIVESHVYTNKDAIFEEQLAEFSETSSVQSAEEINTAFETIETLSTENIALESAIQELETAKVVEETRDLATVTATGAATVQKIEEVVHESKELIQEECKKETASQSTDIKEVLIQESSVVLEPVVEIKETKINKVEKVAVDINDSLSVAESTEISILESKSDLKDIELKTESVAIVEEASAIEQIVESKPKVVEPEPVQIEEITETVKVKIANKHEKPVHDEYAALKIVKKVETEGNLTPEIIEIEDISEDFLSSKVISDIAASKRLELESKKVSEKSIVSSEIGVAKSDAKSVMDISQSSQVSSQIGVTSISQEIEMSKQLQSERKLSKEVVQESSITAKSLDKKLSLRTDLEKQISIQSPPSTIDTPTPSTVPPTPLTDEYVFKLSIPLPRSRSATPVPRDSTLTPEDEDPHIVKKKLIPHIETTIEKVIYDPPLPTPPADKVQSPDYTKPGLNGGALDRPKLPFYSKPGLKGGAKFRYPVYRKPGLFGGADSPEYSKEEIREIERKSSLLASAIDETIKSIEEYKEEVGIETKKEVKMQEFKEEKLSKSYRETYSKEVTVESKQNGLDEIETKIEEIIEQCGDALAAIDNDEANKISIQEIQDKQAEPKTIQIIVERESTQVKSSLEPEAQIESEAKVVTLEKDAEETKVISIENGNVQQNTQERYVEKVLAPVETSIDVKQTENVKIESEIKTNSEMTTDSKAETAQTETIEEKKSDVLLGFRPVVFDPESIPKRGTQQNIVFQEPTGTQEPRQSPYMTETGEIIGTIQGIVDGLEEPVMDAEVAKALGKPGISEEKIAELISGEAEMLREAHVMGLSRVLTSHMHRADDSSVDFQKIKPMIDSLKDSEVLKALNEELARQKAEEKKKEEKRWTTFLQKPKRPVPKAKFGYHGWTEDEQVVAEPYKVKIVKQAKPKVAPDYKPEDFDTGPLPWEERAVTDSSLPPVEPEEPILIPEVPEFLEAVDPLTESEVPDLEDTGIPLPPPKEPTPPPTIEEQIPESEPTEQEVSEEPVAENQEENKVKTKEEMDNRLAEQLVKSVQSMVDPNASVDQQLAQMRAQLAALAQLPEVIQQSLELVSRQLHKMTQQEARIETQTENQSYQQVEESQNQASEMQTIQEVNENEVTQNEVMQNEAQKVTIEELDNKMENQQQNMLQEEKRVMTPVMTEEEMRMEKQRKEQARLEHESRQVKQHPTPRATKPKRVFGPLDPEERMAVVLPGGRRWKNSQDVYDEQKIKETLEANVELIQGKALGINFMKYEKPPVSLDHLKHSEVYKLVHDMDETPLKRVEMRTPVMCEADYRERCRSMTPAADKKHLQIPNQFHP